MIAHASSLRLRLKPPDHPGRADGYSWGELEYSTDHAWELRGQTGQWVLVLYPELLSLSFDAHEHAQGAQAEKYGQEAQQDEYKLLSQVDVDVSKHRFD